MIVLEPQEAATLRQLAQRLVLHGVTVRRAMDLWRRELLLAELALAARKRGYARGMKSRAARQAGVHRNTISRWLKAAGLGKNEAKK